MVRKVVAALNAGDSLTTISNETGLRMECVKRIARGLDLPPEVVLQRLDLVLGRLSLLPRAVALLQGPLQPRREFCGRNRRSHTARVSGVVITALRATAV